VNVGTDKDQIWFAQEQLRIVPYQIYNRPVPERLTGSMVTEAAKTPGHSRAFIENEGLASLGFTTSQIAKALPAKLVSISFLRSNTVH
jgi:eukaryotic translation initiation factor 2C